MPAQPNPPKTHATYGATDEAHDSLENSHSSTLIDAPKSTVVSIVMTARPQTPGGKMSGHVRSNMDSSTHSDDVHLGADQAARPATIDPINNDQMAELPVRELLLPHGSHSEPHFENAEIVRDIIVGLSDGLTVPFALAAGLASLDNSRLVVTAGFAEIVAGSISMGLGGFLAGLSEIEHYNSERLREVYEVEHLPHRERDEIAEIFEPYGIPREAVEPIINILTRNKEVWVDFMMKFELNLEKPDKNRSWISALTIGLSYFLGGVVPLIPYIILSKAMNALILSAAMTIIALFVFGYVKARLIGMVHPLWSAIQMAIVGAAAAGAAYGIAKLIPQK